jgi:hypothetical protein
LQEKLQELSLQLHDTLGFFVLRGLDPNEYSPEDNIILFLGLSSYIGEKRGRQDDAGNMLSSSKTQSLSIPIVANLTSHQCIFARRRK